MYIWNRSLLSVLNLYFVSMANGNWQTILNDDLIEVLMSIVIVAEKHDDVLYFKQVLYAQMPTEQPPKH